MNEQTEPSQLKRRPLVPHVSKYVQDEINERGWDRDILAYMMVCGLTNTRAALKWFAATPREQWEHDWQVTRLGLDFFFEVGPSDPNLRIGERDALRLARAFGTSDGLFANLETAWLRSCGALESATNDPAVEAVAGGSNV